MVLKKVLFSSISFRKIFSLFSLLALNFSAANGQSLPVGQLNLEDYYRRQQLLGKLDSSASLMIRPINPKQLFGVENVFYPDPNEIKYNLLNADHEFSSKDGRFKSSLLPISIKNQFNSHHAYGWNDGAMVPAKGFQTLITGGIFAEYGPVSLQFKPELVYAQNSDFDEFNKAHYDIVTAKYYDFYNNIDLPVRFGKSAYRNVFLGQSSLRINSNSLSFGISTENIWWGPGLRNSLLMSNSAPGFAHLTLNTRKPLKTKIGSFEGQLIAGRLEGSGYGPLTEDREYFNSNLYVPKPNDWRYLTGIVLTYQPKWVPGLFLGYAQTGQKYSKDLSSFNDYLPFFPPFKPVLVASALNERDERRSMFLRWIWLEENAEIYFEYGRSNAKATIRENSLRPEASRGYIVGLRKLMPFGSKTNEHLLLGVEVTQLQETNPEIINNALGWYSNKYVRHGYTNNGQLLGAGIGPGANIQTVEIAWAKGFNKIGLQAERYVHNNDLYFYIYRETNDFRRHWVDMSLGLSGEWNYKNFNFNTLIKGIKSFNYQYYLLQNPRDSYMVNGKDVYNFQFQIGASYRF